MPEVSLAEFEALERSKGSVCTVREALDVLEGADVASLQAALDAQHISGAAISRWLEKRGLTVKQTTVQRHRRKDCSCVR